jgi:hypothetical protein
MNSRKGLQGTQQQREVDDQTQPTIKEEDNKDDKRTTTNTARYCDGEGDEPDPRHWWKTAVAASFPT